jgi:hypothetical protein
MGTGSSPVFTVRSARAFPGHLRHSAHAAPSLAQRDRAASLLNRRARGRSPAVPDDACIATFPRRAVSIGFDEITVSRRESSRTGAALGIHDIGPSEAEGPVEDTAQPEASASATTTTMLLMRDMTKLRFSIGGYMTRPSRERGAARRVQGR